MNRIDVVKYPLPLSESVSPAIQDMCYYWKNPLGEIGLLIYIKANEDQVINNADIIAYLPKGFRPATVFPISCSIGGGSGRTSGSFDLYPDGQIQYFGQQLVNDGIAWGSIVF